MTGMTTPEQPAQAAESARSAKRSAAILSVSAAGIVTVLKLITGLLTGSLGMLSEAAHSGIDLIASGITLFSVQVADRPADEDHNYGHGKVESLSAFFETLIMLASCIWIVTEAMHRILFRHHLAIQQSVWPFSVLLFSIAVDFTRSRALGRTAREHRSDALAADSVHFATDMWASLAVMIGIATAYAGVRYHIPALEYADPAAALLVAGIILRVSWRLARETVDTLLDATPTTDAISHQPITKEQLRTKLIHELNAIPGVLSVDRLRTRRSGSNYFADVTLGMPRSLTFQRSEQLTMAATEAVQRHLPGADVVVHTVPTAALTETVHDRVRAVAARRNLAIHEITVHQLDDGLHVEQHLEVDERMPLRQAHALVTDLESEVRREVPGITSILTHIESEPATIERPSSLEPDRDVEKQLREAAKKFPEILDIHEVFVTRTRARGGKGSGEHIQVNCHCTLPDDLPMSRVHAVITALEGEFKLNAPEVDGLFIHPEPVTDNHR